MNLVAYSMRTKGGAAFGRRLWTVFTRFGVSESRTRASLRSMMDALRPYDAAPTFFIPATVLARSPRLIRQIQRAGAEVGIHGYVHNDYRALPKAEQLRQTRDAVERFKREQVRFEGFRNPYLGWNDDSLDVFRALGFVYDSNEAVYHEGLETLRVNELPPVQADALARSLALFQAISATEYTLRPHTEDSLLRIPTSIPDDEMLFDRLRLTDPDRLGGVWCEVMRRVYDLGGVYVLNLHPERGVLARGALDKLVTFAHSLPLGVWITRLSDIAAWYRERAAMSLQVTPAGDGAWRIAMTGAGASSRAALVSRHVTTSAARMDTGNISSTAWPDGDNVFTGALEYTVQAPVFPGVGVSPRTAPEVVALLREQGYAMEQAEPAEADHYGAYVDLPDGLGARRADQQRAASDLIHRIEHGEAPLVRLGLWPNGQRAALSITGDIDSVTIQDFFLRIAEVRRLTPSQR